MTDTPELGTFYGTLAPWWPLISPVADYAEEAAYIADVLRSGPFPVRRVLELGSGGGHIAYHLRGLFDLTLTDVSGEMLAVSRSLNAECRHVQADMRTLRLNETFDAVFVHDAIDYMTTEGDLAAALHTAAAHLTTNGRLVIVPDDTTESFEPESDIGGSDTADGRGVRFLSWTYDPDPTDTIVHTEYAFVFRNADGTVTTTHETHRTGLFPEATWLRLLEQAGFEATAETERTTEDRAPRTIFIGRRS
jgi:SAM-dependent methyltransferase